MQRREALRILGAAATLPIFSPDVVAFGRHVHSLLASQTGRRTLDPHQDATVTTLAELILPATDTPGAKAARVNEFIDLILTEWFNDGERKQFLDGLADVDARARSAWGKDFVECAEREQANILTALDAEVTRLRESEQPGDPYSNAPRPPRLAQRHFFHVIKRFTLIGYFTSKVGTPPDQQHQFVEVFRPCASLSEALENPEK